MERRTSLLGGYTHVVGDWAYDGRDLKDTACIHGVFGEHLGGLGRLFQHVGRGKARELGSASLETRSWAQRLPGGGMRNGLHCLHVIYTA
jgi:hypothetical protein